MMTEWNGAVDEYMRTEGRLRDRFTVEYEAKIGLDGGPLYKTCCNDDCGRIEKRDIPALMKCAGCSVVSTLSSGSYLINSLHHQALYCSTDCQRKSWRGHKKDCKAGTVQPQESMSQWNFEGLFITMSAAYGMLASGMP
jgi:MYND finger